MTETTFDKSVLSSGFLHLQLDPLENLTSKRKKKNIHRPLGMQKRNVHAPGYGYSDRHACGGASTCPVVQLITVLLFIGFLSQNSTLGEKKARQMA